LISDLVTSLSIYLGCLAFGGLLLGVSAFAGHDHAHDIGHDHDTDKGGGSGAYALLSVRFWSFFVAFFGLTGAVLTWFAALNAAVVAVIAVAAGGGTGYGASRLLDALARGPLGVVSGSGGHLGREGKLLLPVDKVQRGKVRLSIGGASTDLVAETEGDEALPAGTSVLVVGFRGNVALVERSPAASSTEKETS
jgi:membrane protein implicated in regulation of membrane protease activity